MGKKKRREPAFLTFTNITPLAVEQPAFRQGWMLFEPRPSPIDHRGAVVERHELLDRREQLLFGSRVCEFMKIKKACCVFGVDLCNVDVVDNRSTHLLIFIYITQI